MATVQLADSSLDIQHTMFIEDLFSDAYEQFDGDERANHVGIAVSLAEQYKYDYGSTRITFFVSDTDVLKVPLGPNGQEQNWLEADTSGRDGKFGEIPIADCYLIMQRGVEVLMMERVHPATMSLKELPDWAWSVDGAQIGYDLEGRLVAYDL